MTSARAALSIAAQKLRGIAENPMAEAQWLLAHALNVPPQRLLLEFDRAAPNGQFAALVERRAGGEPIAYILGEAPFGELMLRVGPGVLIPRQDSEVLIDAARHHFAERAPATILDLGTGPGTLLLAALHIWPTATGIGVDASDVALTYARDNGMRLGLASQVQWMPGDWGDGGSADLILANPPYIGTSEAIDKSVADFEPALALYAGEDGLDAYRALLPTLAARIHSGGAAIVEIGWQQGQSVAALAHAHGLGAHLWPDLAGRDRALLLTPLLP